RLGGVRRGARALRLARAGERLREERQAARLPVLSTAALPQDLEPVLARGDPAPPSGARELRRRQAETRRSARQHASDPLGARDRTSGVLTRRLDLVPGESEID